MPEQPNTPAAEEQIEYEYVEVPEGQEAEYEYAEVPEGQEIEYEYVEAEAPAAEEGVEYEYVEAEAPAAEEGVEYEYVEAEAPAAEEGVEYEYVEAEAPAAEAPAAEEGVEYEYVEAEAPAEAVETPLPVEEETTPLPTAEPVIAEPELPEEEEDLPPSQSLPETIEETPSSENLASETQNGETDSVSAEQNEIQEEASSSVPAPETEDLEAVTGTDSGEAYEPVEDTALADELEAIETPVSAGTQDEPAGVETATAAVATVAGTAAIDALAEKAAKEADEPENNAQIVAEETQEELDPQEESDSLPATGAYSFDGSQSASFTGSNVMDNVVLINDAHAFDRLNEWYLVVSEFSVTPLEGQNGADVPLSDEVFCQGAFLNADGTHQPFENRTLLTVPADQTNLALCSINAMPLSGQENSTIELSGASGLLIGPNNVRLMFSHVNKITVPEIQKQTAETVLQNKPVIYDSAPLPKNARDVFTFTADDGTVETESENILIKAGYSLYGWNVTFANGQTMSLADVRIYQTKHGVLPDTNGTIGYGQAQLSFKNAKKIGVYEKPSYCGYGKKPE